MKKIACFILCLSSLVASGFNLYVPKKDTMLQTVLQKIPLHLVDAPEALFACVSPQLDHNGLNLPE